ncbi:MAG: glutathione S-transferase [Deltaproteobacteria bacterium]|nr:glutathione S-transferase [Deltaproteobacteria bacterium]
MLTVHHLNNSRSQRVLWLLEELEVPYEIVKYERDPKTSLAPASLKAIHPLGKSPVVTDDGTTVAESGAILEYLVETYGKGRLAPAHGTPDFQRYRYFLHYAEGSLMPFLVMRLVTGRIRQAPVLVRPIAKAIANKVDAGFVTPNLERHVAFLDGELATREWFAGELSAADCQMLFPMQAIAKRVANAPARIGEWVARAEARPAYQRALTKGGTYAVMA